VARLAKRGKHSGDVSIGLTHGSLFAGIGGIDLGFSRAGIETKWQVEINPFCNKVLAKHFPDAQRFYDIRQCGKHNLSAVDIITGGDPCQENSNARRTADTTSPSLGSEFIRIVEELRPRIVVRENPSAVRADAPWPWWRFRSRLEALGYAVLPFRFRACCAGADFRRDRLFLLATLQSAERTRLERDVGQVVADENQGRYNSNLTGPDRWSAAPRICGRADGVPDRVDRLKALGNSVAPRVAEMIGRLIVESELTAA
jgi:DNA (cytosine-5)-methyltransferase 1